MGKRGSACSQAVLIAQLCILYRASRFEETYQDQVYKRQSVIGALFGLEEEIKQRRQKPLRADRFAQFRGEPSAPVKAGMQVGRRGVTSA